MITTRDPGWHNERQQEVSNNEAKQNSRVCDADPQH